MVRVETKGEKMNIAKVILAVDAFAEDDVLTRKMVRLVSAVAAGRKISVEPVYVINPEDLTLAGIFEGRVDEFRRAVEEQVYGQLQGLKLSGLRPATVLLASSISTRGAVQTLLSYAEETGTELIAVGTHSRKGLKRLVLGSFAETLSLHSRIPLLVVNPKQHFVKSRCAHVLFPTDFSTASREGLRKVVAQLGPEVKKITLFHQLESVPLFSIEPLASLPSPDSFVERENEAKEKLGGRWKQSLVKQGIKCDVVLNARSVSVAKAILSEARRAKAGIIAMVSQSGPFESWLLGSTTRRVLRDSAYPVWILHSGTGIWKKAELSEKAAIKVPNAVAEAIILRH